jgi:transposase-like protein
LSLRLAGDDPASNPFVIASLPAKAWDQPVARDRRRQAEQEKKFKAYPIGYFHIDIAEVRTEEGKLYLFVAIDRTSKIAFAKLEHEANRLTATAFLEALIEAIPYSSPICPRTATAQRPNLRRTCSPCAVAKMASSIA